MRRIKKSDPTKGPDRSEVASQYRRDYEAYSKFPLSAVRLKVGPQ